MLSFSSALIGCSYLFSQDNGGSRFVNVKLAHGITVDAPKSWWLLNGQWNAALETAVEAKMDLAKLPNVVGQQVNLLALRSMPEQTFASIRIDYSLSKSPPESVTQMTKNDLEQFAARLKETMPKLLAPEKVLKWETPSIEFISGHPALVTHFIRSGPRGPVAVWIRDIAIGHGSLSLNTSYRVSEAEIWKPVIDRSIMSLKVP